MAISCRSVTLCAVNAQSYSTLHAFFVQDLKSAVERISVFMERELTDEQLANVVKYSTFKNMKTIPQANYEHLSSKLFSHHQGRFMRKGRCVCDLSCSLELKTVAHFARSILFITF